MPFKAFKTMAESNNNIPGNTPLGCLLKRWRSEGFYQDLEKEKMIDYCNHWWPEYERVGPEWPLNGSVDYEVITPLMQFLKQNEKWDEVPYLDLFYLLREKKEWQKECGIMVLELKSSECGGCKEKPKCTQCLALTSQPEKDLSLLVAPNVPPAPASASLSSYPPLPRDSSSDDSEEEKPGERKRERKIPNATIKLQPHTPSPGPSGNVQRTPLANRTRQGRKNLGEPKLIAPLREAVGPQGDRVLIKVPFSPGDLVIWKQSVGSYREDPERVAQVVKMIIRTQNPDWNDLQVLLDTLMDSTEKEMVLKAAKERAREAIRLQLAEGTVNDLVPSEDPGWDPNTSGGMGAIKEYQELLLEGIRTGMPKTLNWSKLYSVRQDKSESPSAFLERLKETARKYTNLEVEDEPGKLQLALIFMGQSQDDIRKKLQKLEGEDTRNLDKMLEVGHWKNECPKRNGMNRVGVNSSVVNNNSVGYPMTPGDVAQAMVLGNYQNQS
ncbi:uncharacterized protein LOC127060436 [Serinus canaria]|uniref:uncharacterized protein LOC127060436 n=1 Tax=Serinus canaria TaxID=9135 RepID=UPI0021CC5690|nr:uncharacterized protein LOC127060436 [Serinus canaria]